MCQAISHEAAYGRCHDCLSLLGVTLDGVLDASSMDQWFAPFDCEERRSYTQRSVLGADALLLGRVKHTRIRLLEQLEHSCR